jgi:FkbM family methyltransferase
MTAHRNSWDGYPPNLSSADLASGDRGTVERAIRERVQTLYLGDGVMLARVLGRHKMFLHTSDRGFACNVAMDGFWESWITQFFARTLKPGMVAVDVGANYGYYTLLFGDAVTASGRVVAVEPNPRAASLLRESVLLNGMATRTNVHEVAAGPPGLTESRLFVPSGEPKNAQLVDRDSYPGGDVVVVPVATLDALTADFARVDLVKIDAEGAEVGIIAGMQEVIRRHHPALVLEFNAARYADAGGFLERLLALYGQVCVVGFDGRAEPVRPETVLTTQVGEDWILYFKHDRTGT